MIEPRTIDCEEALRQLFDYLDAELPAERIDDMEWHLRRCRSCFSRAQFERRLKSRLAALGREAVEPRLARRVRTMIAGFD
jgi:anti-sigma factor (TIGR02949 family)